MNFPRFSAWFLSFFQVPEISFEIYSQKMTSHF